jgi:hypothetical protein
MQDVNGLVTNNHVNRPKGTSACKHPNLAHTLSDGPNGFPIIGLMSILDTLQLIA